MPEPIALVSGKSDQELADEFKQRAIDAYKPLLELCTEANRKGFAMNIGIGPDAFGNFHIQNIVISKVFK